MQKGFPFFNHLHLAIFKMFAMSMGEIEAKDTYLSAMVMEQNGHGTNFITVLVYMGFIFMILMVLMNLLNGLAVSDVQKIGEMAEVDSAMIRLQMIAETDTLFSLFKRIFRYL